MLIYLFGRILFEPLFVIAVSKSIVDSRLIISVADYDSVRPPLHDESGMLEATRPCDSKCDDFESLANRFMMELEGFSRSDLRRTVVGGS